VESGAQSDGQNEHRFKTAELEFLIEDWNLLTTDDRRRTIAIVNGWQLTFSNSRGAPTP